MNVKLASLLVATLASFNAHSQAIPVRNQADGFLMGLAVIIFVGAGVFLYAFPKDPAATLRQKAVLNLLVCAGCLVLFAVGGVLGGLLLDTTTSVGGLFPGSKGYFSTLIAIGLVGMTAFTYLWHGLGD